MKYSICLREAQYKFLIKLYFVVNIYRVVNLNLSFIFFAQQTVDSSTNSARRTAYMLLTGKANFGTDSTESLLCYMLLRNEKLAE